MPNMSYVRFENTYRDLKDCAQAMADSKDLSPSEQEYRYRLIKLCCDIAADYGEQEERDDEWDEWDESAENDDE